MPILIKQIEPWIDQKESVYIKKIIDKKYLTESYETLKFENRIKKRFLSKHAVAVSNWTNGIFMCLKALGIKKDDEVIVPNLTFIATVNAVLMAGGIPKVCEVEKSNLSLDLKKLEKLINKKTKFIIPVHLYGHCCDMRLLKNIAKKKNIKIIEDAAQSMGAKFNNKFLGTIGDVGGFSFYGNKIMTTGEGGIILTNKKNIAKKLYSLKNHGRNKKGIFKHEKIGFNFMFTEMQAAIGNIQLNKLTKIQNKKKLIFLKYKKELSKIKSLNFIVPNKLNYPVHWFSTIFTKKKTKLRKFLLKNGVQTREVFFPIHKQPCYKNEKEKIIFQNQYKVSEEIFNTGISLPSSYSLTSKQQKKIIDLIKKFFN